MVKNEALAKKKSGTMKRIIIFNLAMMLSVIAALGVLAKKMEIEFTNNRIFHGRWAGIIEIVLQ